MRHGDAVLLAVEQILGCQLRQIWTPLRKGVQDKQLTYCYVKKGSPLKKGRECLQKQNGLTSSGQSVLLLEDKGH